MFRFALTALDSVVFSSSSEKALMNLLLLNPNRQTVSSSLVNIEQHCVEFTVLLFCPQVATKLIITASIEYES